MHTSPRQPCGYFCHLPNGFAAFPRVRHSCGLNSIGEEGLSSLSIASQSVSGMEAEGLGSWLLQHWKGSKGHWSSKATGLGFCLPSRHCPWAVLVIAPVLQLSMHTLNESLVSFLSPCGHFTSQVFFLIPCLSFHLGMRNTYKMWLLSSLTSPERAACLRWKGQLSKTKIPKDYYLETNFSELKMTLFKVLCMKLAN
jgi:hypothetical protein